MAANEIFLQSIAAPLLNAINNSETLFNFLDTKNINLSDYNKILKLLRNNTTEFLIILNDLNELKDLPTLPIIKSLHDITELIAQVESTLSAPIRLHQITMHKTITERFIYVGSSIFRVLCNLITVVLSSIANTNFNLTEIWISTIKTAKHCTTQTTLTINFKFVSCGEVPKRFISTLANHIRDGATIKTQFNKFFMEKHGVQVITSRANSIKCELTFDDIHEPSILIVSTQTTAKIALAEKLLHRYDITTADPTELKIYTTRKKTYDHVIWLGTHESSAFSPDILTQNLIYCEADAPIEYIEMKLNVSATPELSKHK